jgi:hypothetical protein
MWDRFKHWLHKPRRDGYTTNLGLIIGFMFTLAVLVAAVLIRDDQKQGIGAAKYDIFDEPRHQEALQDYFKTHSKGPIKPFETVAEHDDE